MLILLAWSYALVLATEKLGEETAAEFATNREQIIGQARSALEGEDYRTVIELADKHLTVNDSELNRLSAEAETALEERARAEAVKSDAEAEQRRAQRVADAAQRRDTQKQEGLAEEQRRAKMTNKELFESDSTEAFVRMEIDKDALRATLKDGKSAEFKDIYISFINDSPVTCGQVNAKNSFGGYNGFKRFISARHAGISVIEGENMEINAFADVWRQSCNNRIEM